MNIKYILPAFGALSALAVFLCLTFGINPKLACTLASYAAVTPIAECTTVLGKTVETPSAPDEKKDPTLVNSEGEKVEDAAAKTE